MALKNKIIFLMIAFTANSLLAANLYTNSGFESNSSGWNLYKQDTSVVAALTLDSAGCMFGKKFCRINVTKVNADPVTNNWYIQLQDPVWQAKKNVNYTFSCWARTDTAGRSIHIAAQGDTASEYTYRKGSTVSLTTDWTKYEFPFPSDVAGTGKLNFFIYLGGSTGVYDFDSMALDSVSLPDTGAAVLGSWMGIVPDKAFFDVHLLTNTLRIVMTGPSSNARTLRVYSLEGRLLGMHAIPAAAASFDIPKPARGAWIVEVNSNKKMIRIP